MIYNPSQLRACALAGIWLANPFVARPSLISVYILSVSFNLSTPTGFSRKLTALRISYTTPQFINVFQAAFDPRVLSAVCFFATDIHSATLGKGGDDSLTRVQAGELTGKGELVVRTSWLC